MKYKEVNIDLIKSDVKCSFYIDESEKILVIDVEGTCRNKSEGSIDINKIFSEIGSYYFWIEPAAILLDISKLKYTYGNSIVKLLNLPEFIGRNEYEKKMPFVIVLSHENDKGILELIRPNGDTQKSKYYCDLAEAKFILEKELSDIMK
jgi:hypothetical protein